MKRYFKRHWDESRGDTYDSWGTSDWLFETDQEGAVNRQIEIYENGTVLKYELDHLQDEFGMLADQNLDIADFLESEISAHEFEESWGKFVAFNRP